MEVVNPIRDGVWIGSSGSGLCGGCMNISSTPLGFLEYWGIYRAKSWSKGHPRWAQPTRARLGLLACPGGLSPPQDSPQVHPGPNIFLLVHKKSPWSFVEFGLRLILIFCDVKNMEKIATGTWHYVNRLVPKNDLK